MPQGFTAHKRRAMAQILRLSHAEFAGKATMPGVKATALISVSSCGIKLPSDSDQVRRYRAQVGAPSRVAGAESFDFGMRAGQRLTLVDGIKPHGFVVIFNCRFGIRNFRRSARLAHVVDSCKSGGMILMCRASGSSRLLHMTDSRENS